MFRLLVAEDEPAAMRYITSLVEVHCDEVEIVSQAEDGAEAQKALETLPVDILITDIQMPRMNGIELAQWVCDHKPGIVTLVVSGYSEFEYAKGALQAGVVEYLLKPFTPAIFAEAMQKLCRRAHQNRRAARERWLRRALAGTVGMEDFPGLYRREEFQLCILVLGAAIGRYHPPDQDFAYQENSPDLLAATYIHDESEICFALRPGSEADLRALVASLSGDAPYHTAAQKTILSGEACPMLPEMLQAAKRAVIPGKSQVVEYRGVLPPEPEPSQEEQSLVRQLQYAAANAQTERIKSGLAMLFDLWKLEVCPLLSAEATLLRLVQTMAQNAPPGHGLSHRDIAEGVHLFCHDSADYADMLDKAWAFVSKLYLSLERRGESGRLINSIEAYIREHLGEPLSAQSICAVFGLSVSNLHRVFRKHVDMSYVEYITALRIKEAKRMMTAYPDLSIKDIAGHLGFSDQFYFSKVFRSLTGTSPSEYRTHADNDKNE